jgi:hypothetical protein
VGLADRTGPHGWWDWHPSTTEQAAEYLLLESLAAEIMICEPQLVPDLLQAGKLAGLLVSAVSARIQTDHRPESDAEAAERHGERGQRHHGERCVPSLAANGAASCLTCSLPASG